MANHTARAFATTVPDAEPVRDSYVRIRASSHPLSGDIRRLAEAVRRHADDIRAAAQAGSAARVLQLMDELPAKQLMLADQLDKHAHTAEVHEKELVERMRMIREILEARHT